MMPAATTKRTEDKAGWATDMEAPSDDWRMTSGAEEEDDQEVITSDAKEVGKIRCSERLVLHPEYATDSEEKSTLKVKRRTTLPSPEDSSMMTTIEEQPSISQDPDLLPSIDVRPSAVSVRRRRDFGEDSLIDNSIESYSARSQNSAGIMATTQRPFSTQGPALESEISAYVVEEDREDDVSFQQKIMQSARLSLMNESVEATQVQPWQRNRRRRWINIGCVVVILAAIGLAVGIPVALTKGSSSPSPSLSDQVRDDNLVASLQVSFTDDTGLRGFASVETRLLEFANLTSGDAGNVICSVQPCIDNPGSCTVGNDVYEDGCCLGMDCPEESKCGENCAAVPNSCFLKDESKGNCHSKDCYICNQVGGQDIWKLSNRIFDIDCMKAGVSVRGDSGKPYKWAIICGAVVSGPEEKANFGSGEYACSAYRSGADFLNAEQKAAVVAPWRPCQFISLGECGCAPANVHTFGLPPPHGPCLPGGNCTFLCADVGTDHARNLCHAFPGDIKWFEGENFMNWNLFSAGSVGASVDIYIKDHK